MQTKFNDRLPATRYRLLQLRTNSPEPSDCKAGQ